MAGREMVMRTEGNKAVSEVVLISGFKTIARLFWQKIKAFLKGYSLPHGNIDITYALY